MRLARTIGALVALIMAVTMGQALVSPSQAAKATKHQISAQGYEKGNTNKFYIKGKIATAPKTKVKVLRNVSGGPFKAYKTFKTKSSGKFNVKIDQVGNKKTCFKIQVPAKNGYKKTTSPNLGCITTTRV
jgi:gas vesicle protein